MTRRRIGAIGAAAVAGGLLALCACSSDRGPEPPIAAGLDQFQEIDLGALRGEDVRIGSARSELVPMVRTDERRGRTSLAVLDAEEGTIVDAGPLPVDGWAVEGLAVASDRYVVIAPYVCSAEPGVSDTGLDCTNEPTDAPLPIELLIYDIARDSWQRVPVGSAPDRWVVVEAVDGATATLRRLGIGEPDTWAQVDLADPVAPTSYSSTEPAFDPPAWSNVERRWVGDGWTMDAPDTRGDVTWEGTVAGEPRTFAIPSRTPEVFGAGRCILMASTSSDRLDHLHRLCAS